MCGGGNTFILLMERMISSVSMKVFAGLKTTKQSTLWTDPTLLVPCIYRKDSKCLCHREASNPCLKQHYLQKQSNRTNPCAHQQMNKENMANTDVCSHAHMYAHMHAHKHTYTCTYEHAHTCKKIMSFPGKQMQLDTITLSLLNMMPDWKIVYVFSHLWMLDFI